MLNAVILAAGKGKRLGKLGVERQKATLDIGKPLLQHNIEILEKYCSKIVIIVGHRKEDIINCINNFKSRAEVVLVEQKEQKGTAHAVSLSQKHVNKDFFVIFGDNVLSKEYIEKLLYSGADSVGVYQVEDPWNYGVVKENNGFMADIIEKPEKGTETGNLVHAGINFFNQKIFDAIARTKINEKRNEYEITDSYKLLISDGEKIKLVEIPKPVHVSTQEDYKKLREKS